MKYLLCHGDAGTQYLLPCTPSQPHSFCRTTFSTCHFSFPSFPHRTLSPTFYLLPILEFLFFSAISFEGQDFQILDTKISSTWGKAKKNLKSQVSNQSSHKVLWNKCSFQEEAPSCNHALHWLSTSDTKRAFKMMGLRPCNVHWSPSHCLRGPLQHVKCHYRLALQACQATTYQAMLHHQPIEANVDSSALE